MGLHIHINSWESVAFLHYVGALNGNCDVRFASCAAMQAHSLLFHYFPPIYKFGREEIILYTVCNLFYFITSKNTC